MIFAGNHLRGTVCFWDIWSLRTASQFGRYLQKFPSGADSAGTRYRAEEVYGFSFSHCLHSLASGRLCFRAHGHRRCHACRASGSHVYPHARRHTAELHSEPRHGWNAHVHISPSLPVFCARTSSGWRHSGRFHWSRYPAGCVRPDSSGWRRAASSFVCVLAVFCQEERTGKKLLGRREHCRPGGTAISFDGPPAGAYALWCGWEPRQALGTLGVFFVLRSLITCSLQAWSGLYTEQILTYAAYGFPACVLGVLCAFPVVRRVRGEIFRRFLMAVVAAGGLVCLWNSFH